LREQHSVSLAVGGEDSHVSFAVSVPVTTAYSSLTWKRGVLKAPLRRTAEALRSS
jgi:hypothetical protein